MQKGRVKLMRFKEKKDSNGLFKSILMAYIILVLHVFLIAGLGILVLFFHGIVNYMIWIFLVGSAAILASGYYFYRRMKAEGKTLREMLSSPLLRGRAVEISFLGGLASFKIGRPGDMPALGSDFLKQFPQLEDPDSIRIRELTELARLLEKDLITRDEYDKAKQQIFKFRHSNLLNS